MKKFRKIFWPQIGCDQKKLVPRHPHWKIQSPECSVNKKILKKFLVSNLVWPKKVGLDPPWQIQSRVLSKGKNSENFLTLNLSWPENVGAQTLLLKNSESRVLGKWKNSEKLFDLKFEVSNKSCPRPPPLKKSFLSKWKNSEKNFGLKFGVTKKSGCLDPPSQKIQSPECSVNEKIPKIFLTSNLV